MLRVGASWRLASAADRPGPAGGLAELAGLRSVEPLGATSGFSRVR
jgi:hypothetical protein